MTQYVTYNKLSDVRKMKALLQDVYFHWSKCSTDETILPAADYIHLCRDVIATLIRTIFVTHCVLQVGQNVRQSDRCR